MADTTHIRVQKQTHERLRDIKYQLIVEKEEYENHSFDDIINRLATEAGY